MIYYYRFSHPPVNSPCGRRLYITFIADDVLVLKDKSESTSRAPADGIRMVHKVNRENIIPALSRAEFGPRFLVGEKITTENGPRFFIFFFTVRSHVSTPINRSARPYEDVGAASFMKSKGRQSFMWIAHTRVWQSPSYTENKVFCFKLIIKNYVAKFSIWKRKFSSLFTWLMQWISPPRGW